MLSKSAVTGPNSLLFSRGLVCVAMGFVFLPLCAAAQSGAPATKNAKPAAGAAKSPATPAAEPSSEEAAAREKILRSQSWQHTLRRFDEWLSAQSFYDAQQVKQTKARLQVGIGRMSALQLEKFQQDLDAKLDLLTSDRAHDASAYLTQTLEVASPAYARKLRQQLPDLLTMSAEQINHQLAALAAKHRNAARVQDNFDDSKRRVVAFNDWRVQQGRRKEREKARARREEDSTSSPQNYRPASEYYPLADVDEIGGISNWSGWGGGFF